VVLALFAAHTFLAYFVGVDKLAEWVRLSPVEHPTSFAIMALTTAAMFADFAWFREQTCLVACPYGRIQAALLDRHSLIVAYDERRGEPRTKGKAKVEGAGDCIDCGACVLTCPTGIDIRDGLQMECIHCTQCADACDEIMRKVNRPEGLIRYGSQAIMAGERAHRLRPRTVLYPAALALTFGGFLFTLGTKPSAEVTVLRGLGEPYVIEQDGRVANQLRVKITNRAGGDREFTVAIDGIEGGTMIAPQNPLRVEKGRTETSGVFVLMPAGSFEGGQRQVTVRVSDATGYETRLSYRLLGPGE
jgi:cytochrome c oxidase accessory protein FixG